MHSSLLPRTSNGGPRTIVVLDDIATILDTYRELLRRHFRDKYSYRFFTSDAQAERFVSKNRSYIIGYIQDMNRSMDTGVVAGIAFFSNVIDRYTPWAKCLIISGIRDYWPVLELCKKSHKIDFISKFDMHPDLEIGDTGWLREKLDWLTTFVRTEWEHVHDAETSAIVEYIIPGLQRLCRYIISRPDFLHSMDPREFELLAGDIYKSYGFTVDFTARTRDGGHDIVAIRNIGPSKFRVLIDAKRYHPRRIVGVNIIRSLYGIKQANAASQLVLVTSSFVSEDAKKEFARVVPWELDFYERDKIIEWCREQSSVKCRGFAR